MLLSTWPGQALLLILLGLTASTIGARMVTGGIRQFKAGGMGMLVAPGVVEPSFQQLQSLFRLRQPDCIMRMGALLPSVPSRCAFNMKQCAGAQGGAMVIRRYLSGIAVCTFLVGGLLLAYARRLELPLPDLLPLLIVGIGIALAGLDLFIKGYEIDEWGTPLLYTKGLPSRLNGILIMLLGAAVMIFAATEMGGSGTLRAFVATRPGQAAALLILGLVVVIIGLSLITETFRGRGPGRFTFLSTLPGVFSGSLMLLAGLALVGLGIVRLLAPQALDPLFQRLYGLLGPQ